MIDPSTITRTHHTDSTGAVVYGLDAETGRTRWGWLPAWALEGNAEELAGDLPWTEAGEEHVDA